MQLKSLVLHSFRNYKEAFFSFSPHINHIFGENAQGKTNLLEAVFFLIMGRSFRTPYLRDLILNGEQEFYIEALFEKNGVDQTLKISCDGIKRKIVHNHTQIPALSSLLGLCLGVLFSPQDHLLVKGTPLERREFLDIHISQYNPFYVFHLSRFYRAMRQRNILLKRRELSTIESWEEEMAKSAGYITMERKRTVKALEAIVPEFHSLLSGRGETLSFIYKTSIMNDSCENTEHVSEAYLKQLGKLRKRELDIGSTLIGPHKDDLIFTLEGREARFFASEGQQRTCVAALKLAEWLLLKRESGQIPLFCIDDAGISLDQRREQYLIEQLMELGQVFITSPKMSLTSTLKEAHRIEITNPSCHLSSFLSI